ncbi:MAG: hypothetical protein FWG42_09335 [Clostridiales bacterium]|nr:hypothetical protein [Clostridiales bacterium]
MKKLLVILLGTVLTIVLSALFFTASALGSNIKNTEICPAKYPIVMRAMPSANGTAGPFDADYGTGGDARVQPGASFASPQGGNSTEGNRNLFDLLRNDRASVLVRMLILMTVPLINLFIVSRYNRSKRAQEKNN